MMTTRSDFENTSSRNLSDRFVTITYQHHPYRGEKLELLQDMDHCLYVLLPDGTRSLIPKRWTDYSNPSSEESHLLDIQGLLEITNMVARMKQKE
jgi:hypothetical protein